MKTYFIFTLLTFTLLFTSIVTDTSASANVTITANGTAQPNQPPANNGTAQPNQPPANNGTAQPNQPPANNGTNPPAPNDNNGTAQQGQPLNNNGTQPAPNNSTNNNGPPKRDDVVMSDGSINPMYLPAKDEAACTVEMTKINNTEFNKYKSILCFLPPYEQDIIAGCYNSNNDTLRFVDPDCYKNAFYAGVKNSTAVSVAAKITGNSQNSRNSLSCIIAFANSNKKDNDTIVASSIQTQVDNIVKLQPQQNSASAAFVKALMELLNSRRRFVITTKENMASSVVLDSKGTAISFVFTLEEQSTIVNAFSNYTASLSTFITGFTDGVLGAQSAVSQLSTCKAPGSSSATTASSRLRLLQANPPQNNQPTTTGNNTGQGNAPNGQQPAQNNTGQPGQNNTGTQPPQNNNGTQPNGNNNGTASNPTNGQQPNGNNNGTAPNPNNGQQSNGNNNGTVLISNTNGQQPPQNNNPPPPRNSNKNVDVPPAVNNAVNDTISCLANKTGNEWTTFIGYIQTLNTNLAGNIKTKSALFKDVTASLSNSEEIDAEFDVAGNNENCDKDYIYYCTSNVCVCSGEGCPANLKGSKQYATAQLNVTADSSSTSLNVVQNYYIGSVCCGKLRTVFSTVSYSLTGTLFDYINSKKGADLGKAAAKQNLNCVQALASNSANSTAKSNCRGAMTQDCSDKLDKVCSSTGLNSALQTNPPALNPNPKECNQGITGYTDKACFDWILNHLTKGSISFDYAGFNSLASAISSDTAQPNPTLRLLESSSSYQTTQNDPTSSDSKSKVDGSIKNSDMSVDNSTSSSTASYSAYSSNLNTTAKNTNSASYIQKSLGLLICTLLLSLF